MVAVLIVILRLAKMILGISLYFQWRMTAQARDCLFEVLPEKSSFKLSAFNFRNTCQNIFRREDGVWQVTGVTLLRLTLFLSSIII